MSYSLSCGNFSSWRARPTGSLFMKREWEGKENLLFICLFSLLLPTLVSSGKLLGSKDRGQKQLSWCFADEWIEYLRTRSASYCLLLSLCCRAKWSLGVRITHSNGFTSFQTCRRERHKMGAENSWLPAMRLLILVLVVLTATYSLISNRLLEGARTGERKLICIPFRNRNQAFRRYREWKRRTWSSTATESEQRQELLCRKSIRMSKSDKDSSNSTIDLFLISFSSFSRSLLLLSHSEGSKCVDRPSIPLSFSLSVYSYNEWLSR